MHNLWYLCICFPWWAFIIVTTGMHCMTRTLLLWPERNDILIHLVFWVSPIEVLIWEHNVRFIPRLKRFSSKAFSKQFPEWVLRIHETTSLHRGKIRSRSFQNKTVFPSPGEAMVPLECRHFCWTNKKSNWQAYVFGLYLELLVVSHRLFHPKNNCMNTLTRKRCVMHRSVSRCFLVVAKHLLEVQDLCWVWQLVFRRNPDFWRLAASCVTTSNLCFELTKKRSEEFCVLLGGANDIEVRKGEKFQSRIFLNATMESISPIELIRLRFQASEDSSDAVWYW